MEISASELKTPDQLRALRTSLGLKQAAAASLIGVDQATVSRWESGRVPIDPGAVRKLVDEIDEDCAGSWLRRRMILTNVGDCWPSLITYYRMTRGVSQGQLAEIFGVESTTIYRWETGFCRPNLSQQKRLRDLLFAPLETSSQFERVCRNITCSPRYMYLSMGSCILKHSPPLDQLNRRHQFDVHPFSVVEEAYGGRLCSWMSARSEAGFLRGDVAKTAAVYRLSSDDARYMIAFPLRIEDGRVLTLGYHVPVDSHAAEHLDGTFEIKHADMVVD